MDIALLGLRVYAAAHEHSRLVFSLWHSEWRLTLLNACSPCCRDKNGADAVQDSVMLAQRHACGITEYYPLVGSVATCHSTECRPKHIPWALARHSTC